MAVKLRTPREHRQFLMSLFGRLCDVLEGGHGKDEALERAVLDAVPGAGRVLGRLLRVELLDLSRAKAEEVDELHTSGKDLLSARAPSRTSGK